MSLHPGDRSFESESLSWLWFSIVLRPQAASADARPSLCEEAKQADACVGA